MIYHQFQQSPLQHRFTGTKGWLAFAIGLVVMTLVLLALPFIILTAAVSLIVLSVFGRLFLKRQLAKFRQYSPAQDEMPHQAQRRHTQAEYFEQQAPFTAKSVPRQGRTFDHDPNE